MREIAAQHAVIQGSNGNGGADQFNGGGGGGTAPPQGLIERLKDYGQEDAFALWDELSNEERDLLVKDIQVICCLFRDCCELCV